MRSLLVLVVLSVLLIACATPEEGSTVTEPLPPEEQESVPELDVPEQETPPQEIVEEFVEEGREGEVQDEVIAESADGSAKILACDKEARGLSFMITNTQDVTWDFSGNVPLVPPQGTIAAWIFFNNYQVNSKFDKYDADSEERFFGPGPTFKENCGGTNVLAPGESMTCTFQPVPFILEDSMRVDYFELDVPNSKGFSFACE